MASRQRVKTDDQDRAAEIYLKAARVIHDRGFDATSMNDIADAVSLTKAGLYHYFPGKKELLFAIMQFAMDLLETEVVAPAREEEDPERRLRVVIVRHVGLLAADIGPLTVLMDEVRGLITKHRRLIVRRKRAYFEFVRDALKELQQQRRLRNVDPTVASFSILGMIMWVSRWSRADGPLNPEQIGQDIATIALEGVLRDSGRERSS